MFIEEVMFQDHIESTGKESGKSISPYLVLSLYTETFEANKSGAVLLGNCFSLF